MINELTIEEKIKEAKLKLLKMHYDANVGHLGGNLSCLDILMVLYHQIMGPEDQLVLSKGHSAGALYVTLNSLGKISDKELGTFHGENTRLPGHPPCNVWDDILFSTGSLGHGASLATGLGLAKKLKGEGGRVYCLISDGELQEGSTVESLKFGAFHNLELSIVIDENRLQGYGKTSQISVDQKEWIDKRCIKYINNGNKASDIFYMLNKYKNEAGFQVFFANTVKGLGIKDLENKMKSHYLPLTKEQYDLAVRGVENGS